MQRLTHAEYGSASGLAKLEDLAGDVRFAAAVGAQWLSSDEAFIDMARQRVRELRRRQKGLYRALAEAGLDGLPAADGGGRRPVLALVDFGAEEPVEDDETLTYEMIRDTTGEVIAIVIADGQGRVTLLTMYPAIGGTVVVSIRYDEWGEAVAKLCSTYDEQGNLVDVVDLLATESTEVHRAQTLVSSEPSVASVAEASLDGGMMTMSTPTAPPAATEVFVYDRLGNRVTYTDKEGYPTTYAHNGLNQYTHVHRDLVWDLEEDYWPEHDANGNLSRDRYGYVYSYDYRNRLTQIAGELAFGYDALGRRIKKADDDAGVTTYFYHDPFGRVIAEYEKPDGGSAALARVFVYGNGIDEVLAMFTPYHAGEPADWDEFLDFCGVWLLDSGDPGYDDAFDVVDDNVIDLKDFAVFAASWDLPSSEESDWYYLHDALGSVIGIVGARFGRDSDRQFILYDAYGQPDTLPANGNPYLFTGRRYDWVDDDLVLYYLRARHYSPLTGRFVQTDPIGYADSMNLYEYVTSNPTNYVDPWGLSTRAGTSAIELAVALDYGIETLKKTLHLPGPQGDTLVLVDVQTLHSGSDAIYRSLHSTMKDGLLHTPRIGDWEYTLRMSLNSREFKQKYWAQEYARRQLEEDFPPGVPMTSLARGLLRMFSPELGSSYDAELATAEIGWGVFEIVSFASSGCAREPSAAFNYSDDLTGLAHKVGRWADDAIGLVDEGANVAKRGKPTVFLDENIYFMRDHLARQGYTVRQVTTRMPDTAIRAMVEREGGIFITRNYTDFRGMTQVVRVSGSVDIQRQLITTLNSLEAATVNPSIWQRMPQIPASGLNSGTLRTATQARIP